MAAVQSSEKPSYLGMLNAISLAETAAGISLQAWANATPCPELAKTLSLVAARETSHGDVFCRRIAELGFELKHKAPDPKEAARLIKLANPRIPDCEKLPVERDETDSVIDFFGEVEKKCAAGEYDPMTANLLTWYIAEERESAKRLKAAYARVRSAAGAQADAAPSPTAASGKSGSLPSEDIQALMACMTDGFARLEKTLKAALPARK